MNWLAVVGFLLVSNQIFQTAGEFYSSVHKMSQIMDFEMKMLQNMQKFIRKNQNKLDFLKE